MRKTHFIIALEPRQVSKKLIALCGAEIRNPESTVMTDVLRWGMPHFNSLRDCKECIDAVERAAENRDDTLYVYGLVEGQLVKTAEEVA